MSPFCHTQLCWAECNAHSGSLVPGPVGKARIELSAVTDIVFQTASPGIQLLFTRGSVRSVILTNITLRCNSKQIQDQIAPYTTRCCLAEQMMLISEARCWMRWHYAVQAVGSRLTTVYRLYIASEYKEAFLGAVRSEPYRSSCCMVGQPITTIIALGYCASICRAMKISQRRKAKQIKAKQSKAKQSKAKQSKAKQSKAKQSKAKQSKAKQSNVFGCQYRHSSKYADFSSWNDP